MEAQPTSKDPDSAPLPEARGSAFGASLYGVAGKWKHDVTGDEFIVVAPDMDALKRVMATFKETVDETKTKSARLAP